MVLLSECIYPCAPSNNLLRFLRSQSQNVSFSSRPPAYPRRPHADTKKCLSKPIRRHLNTTAPQNARIQSSYMDDLWPRHRDCPKALPSPNQSRLYHRTLQSFDNAQSSGKKNGYEDSCNDESRPPGFFRRLFGLRKRVASSSGSWASDSSAQKNQNGYEDPSAQLFNLSRAMSRSSSSSDLKLRCTEFDSAGSVTLVSGEFKKSELIAKYGLLPRDLRKIDSSVLPHILVRPSAILINLLHLRVLIQSDRVLVFDAYGSTDSYTQSLFMYDLEGRLRQKPSATDKASHLPYEFRALEAVLISATSGLESEFEGVRDPVVRVLRALESDIDREKLRHLLIHSKKLGTFEQKARLVRDAIDDLLEADDDLAAMYLSEKKTLGKCREENDHEEVEMLLESYHKICDEIVEISGNLITNIRNTEEVVKAILDANRNQLMLLDLKFSIGTLGLAGGTLVAGLYGMNLKNFFEESDFAFGTAAALCFGLSAIVCVYGMRKLRKVQTVRMWGEGVVGFGAGRKELIKGRGNWRDEAMEYHAGQMKTESRRKLNMGEGGGSGKGGPVLWPGMDGLGMHKLEMGEGAAADTGPSVTIKNDVVSPEERVREVQSRQRTLPVKKVGEVKRT